MNQMKTELMKLKDQSMNALAQITEKRRFIEEHFTIIMSSIHFAEEEVKKLQGDMDLTLAKVMSILESDNQQSVSELIDDVKDCSHQLPALLHEKNLLPITSKSAQPQDVTHSAINRSISPKSFVLEESIFILKIRIGDVTNEIWIQPCLSFNNEFVQNIGTYCYKSPKTLNSFFQVGELGYRHFLTANINKHYMFLLNIYKGPIGCAGSICAASRCS